MKIQGHAANNTLQEKISDAREMCLARIRMVPRDKREAVADSILALADQEWWERRNKGSEVFLLILELRKDKVLRIMQDASK
jgi:hypothetical protein